MSICLLKKCRQVLKILIFYVVEELMAKIEKAVMRLPDSYRITFEMSRYQDKTYKEIAKELNVSIKLVEYRIQQALRLYV